MIRQRTAQNCCCFFKLKSETVPCHLLEREAKARKLAVVLLPVIQGPGQRHQQNSNLASDQDCWQTVMENEIKKQKVLDNRWWHQLTGTKLCGPSEKPLRSLNIWEQGTGFNQIQHNYHWNICGIVWFYQRYPRKFCLKHNNVNIGIRIVTND